MRILVLANFDVGLYNFRKELLQRLIDEGNEVYISLPCGEKVDLLKEIGCKFIDTQLDRHGTNPFAELKLIRYYKNLMRRIKPDVVFSYTIKPNLYGGMAAAALSISYIVNITGMGTVFEKGGVIKNIVMTLYRFALRKAKCIFVQNRRILDFFKENHLQADRLRLIPGSGVNTNIFEVLPYPDNREINMLFVGRLMKDKGIDEYLEAAEVIRDKYNMINFHICGFCEAEYETKLNTLVESNAVVYHGNVSDVREIFKTSHCIIHPSYHEGMSNVLLEASASGRPCLCSNIPGCKEIVDDGVTGFYFDPKSSKSIIEAVEKFLALSYEQREKMGLNARKKVEKEFDRNIVVDAYMDEINKIKEKKNARSV